MRSFFIAPWVFSLFSSGNCVCIAKSPWLVMQVQFISGTGKVLFQMESEKKNYQNTENNGNLWKEMYNWANQHWEDLCSWRLKSSLAGSTGMVFSFLRPNAGFGHVPLPRWDQAGPLCSLRSEIWGVPTPGTWGHSLSAQVAGQARVHHWLPPACPVSQGWGLGGGRAQRVVLGPEPVPASLRGLGTRFGRLRVQPGSPDQCFVLIVVMALSRIIRFPLPRDPVSKLKVRPSSGLNHHGCADFMLTYAN